MTTDSVVDGSALAHADATTATEKTLESPLGLSLRYTVESGTASFQTNTQWDALQIAGEMLSVGAPYVEIHPRAVTA